MVYEIWVDGKRIVKREKKGKHNWIFFEDGTKLATEEAGKKGFTKKCKTCGKNSTVKIFRSAIKPHNCDMCKSAGKNNPFYGKKHKDSTKSKISQKKVGKSVGEKNPFYGKKHSEESLKKMREYQKDRNVGPLNPFYGKKHSLETRKKISDATKAKITPKSIEIFRLRAIKMLKQKKFRMTLPEKQMKKWFEKHKIKATYNKILNNTYQYDFTIKNTNILIEVHGDYWHGNPLFYGDSPNLKPLNERQKFKQRRDLLKKEYAESLGYKILYIWENDIKNNNFKVLEDFFNENKINTDQSNQNS